MAKTCEGTISRKEGGRERRVDLPASNIFLSPSAAYAPLHSQEGGEAGRENRIDSREGAFPMGQLDALLLPKYFLQN